MKFLIPIWYYTHRSIKLLNDLLYFSTSIIGSLLFNEKDLNSITNYFYGKSNKYKDNLWNSSKGFYKWEKNCIEQYFPKKGTILVTSCGAGREVIELIKLGFNVYATECQEKLFKITQNNVPDIKDQIYNLAPHKIPKNIFFDSVIIGWGAYSHLIFKKNRMSLLKDIYSQMNNDGYLLLSFLYKSDKKYLMILDNLLYYINKFRKFRGIEAIEKGTILSLHIFKTYTYEEVNSELDSIGFVPIISGKNTSSYPFIIVKKK